jgi:hypothetical protein
MNSPSLKPSLQTTLRHLAGAMIALVLLVTGCNLPSSSVTPTASIIPTAAVPLPSPTPAEPVQSRSLDQALYDGVENGTWTVEESILTGLRFLAGEVSSDEAFGDTPLMSTEGTGVIYSAQRYIFEGADEAAKVEIQRYLDMLMPSPEILDQISRPIAQADSTSHMARVVNRPDSDQIVCQDMWARSFTNIAPIDCLLLDERTVRGTNLRLYYPEYWGAGDPRLDSMEVIMDAAEKSVEQYNGYGPEPINTVYMVFTDLAFFDTNDSRFDPEVFAAAYNFDPGDSSRPTTCRIGIFPYGIEGSSESLQQTIAHEMFHCYQYKNLQPETLVVNRAFNLWWIEGTAEFYGATVYPTNNDEFIFNDDFQSAVPGSTLFEMSYENYLFFQFLAREGGFGLNGVVDILRNMPESGDFEDQQDALAAVGGVDEIFHNFARAYMDRRLTDWGGGSVSIEPQVELFRSFVEGPNEELFDPSSFFLGLYYVTFEDQTKFTNSALEEGDAGRYAIRPREFVGAWQPVPPRINTVCDPTEYVMAVTSTLPISADPYQVTVNATGEHQETDVCDECLHGTWELDINSDYYYMYTLVGTIINMLPSYGLDTSSGYTWLDNVSGQMLISFSEDNVASGTQSDYSWTVTGIDYEHPDRPISMVSTFNGGGTANYTLQETPEEEKWIFFNNGEFDISNQVTFMDRPLTTIPTGGSNTSIFLSSPVRYECSEDTLLYTTMPEIGTLIFHRVPGEAP